MGQLVLTVAGGPYDGYERTVPVPDWLMDAICDPTIGFEIDGFRLENPGTGRLVVSWYGLDPDSDARTAIPRYWKEPER